MKKILRNLGIGFLGLIVVVAVGLGLYIGPIVKIGMEEIGPQITKVSVKVDAVGVSLLTGGAQIKGLIVGNPDGYKMPQAISVADISVSVNPFSVFSNKIIVHAVHVKSPEITFEGGLGGSNLSKILNNVNAQAQNGGPSSNTNNGAENKPAQKIEVDDFLITGAKVHVSLRGLAGREMTLPLPQIHLRDLGKGDNGLTPVELTRAVLDAIIKGTVNVVASSVMGTVQTAGTGMNNIASTFSGLFGK